MRVMHSRTIISRWVWGSLHATGGTLDEQYAITTAGKEQEQRSAGMAKKLEPRLQEVSE